MSRFLAAVLLGWATLSVVVAQNKVTVTVPVEGIDDFDITFDLTQRGDITNAARSFCIQKAADLGITTEEQLTKSCIPNVEDYMVATLLANKVLTNQATTNIVDMSIVVEGGDSFQISFDPSKSTPAQLAEYFCVEKQKELKITTQSQLDDVCIPSVTQYIARRLQPPVTSAAPQQLKSAPIQTKTVPKDIRTINIPVEQVGDIPLTIDINAVTANQAADYVCRQYAGDFKLNTESDLQEKCVPPISSYIQKIFATSTQPNIQSINMKVSGKADVEFSFDVNKVSVKAAAEEVCIQKQKDFNLLTPEDVVQNCVPPVADFINRTLKERNLIR